MQRKQPGHKRTKLKISSRHAQRRLVQRAPGLSFYELEHMVFRGEYKTLCRQSCTRSLCKADGPDGPVYFILNRERRSIVTVLTAKQASLWLAQVNDKVKEGADG